MSAALLEVRGVSRFFGGLAALTDVDFSMARGEVLGLIGPNGAGKTTIIKAILNLVRPDQGQIAVFGLDTAARGS